MPSYTFRVSIAYDDVSGVIQTWSESCEKMVVYEHERDTEVNRTHIHGLIVKCKYKTPEALKRQMISRVELTDEQKGNALWSWKEVSDDPAVWNRFITYMSKGYLAPKFLKEFLPAEIEELRLQWVAPTPKGESLTEKKESTKTKYDLLQDMLSQINNMEVDGKCTSYLADYLVTVVVNTLRKNRIVIGRYKVREYRDALMYYKGDLEKRFINFVNEDFKDTY